MGNRLFLGRFGGGRKLVDGETGASIADGYWGFRGFAGGVFRGKRGKNRLFLAFFGCFWGGIFAHLKVEK